MTTLYPNLILDALRHVNYPGSGKNIVELGLVSDDIRIDGNQLSFSLSLKAGDPLAKSLVKACEQAILTYVDKEVDVKERVSVRFESPQAKAPALAQVKAKIAIASGKGGVGKSTVSANLAVALAKQGYKVGLLDADIFGPSIPKMFGIEDARPVANDAGQMMPIEKYGVKILSIGFFVNPDTAIVWRGAMASNAIKQLIEDADWGELDYFLIDLPPGTSDIHLSLVQTIKLSGAIIVSTPQAVALCDAIKGIDLFENEKIKVPILGMIENMAWFTPAELPNNRYYLFGREGVKNLCTQRGYRLLGQIPLVQSVCTSGDEGCPATVKNDGIVGKAFDNVVKNSIFAEILKPV